jgi:hypothetical protein
VLPVSSLLYLINFTFGLIEILLSLRVILRLFGANPNTEFVQWIYQTSAPLIQPFIGVFPHPTLSGGFVLEFSALFALVIYGLVSYLITEFLVLVQYSSSQKMKSK